MKKETKDVLIGGIVVLILGMIFLAWATSDTLARERKTEEATILMERIHGIREEMRDLPPGGELEVLSADLRKAEAELEKWE